MAAPGLTLSLLVLLIASIGLSQALRRTGPKRCCFSFTRPVDERRVMGYKWTHQQCSNAAVLLKMKNGHVCANPSQHWVKELMWRLDSKALSGNVVGV